MSQPLESSLDKISVSPRLVDELYAHGKITLEAREYALELLYPEHCWSTWISRIFLAIGSALVLSGIVYFFAFNWAKITPLVKFSSIQIALIACLIGAYFCSLQRVSGQVFLLSASVLTGVFMAVFGQIYQTGADAYQLFMMWSLLTLGWTLISNFAPQWIFWLAVSNTFIVLWWQQSVLPERDMEYMLYVLLMFFNGFALMAREYFVGDENKQWLRPKWIGLILTSSVLVSMLIPLVVFVFEIKRATPSVLIAALLGFVGHALIYAFYRYKKKDMWCLSASILSICIVAEMAGLKFIWEVFKRNDITMFLLMGIMTMGVFTVAVIYLRNTLALLEVKHV